MKMTLIVMWMMIQQDESIVDNRGIENDFGNINDDDDEQDSLMSEECLQLNSIVLCAFFFHNRDLDLGDESFSIFSCRYCSVYKFWNFESSKITG